MISSHIEDLITATKAMPNGQYRNKLSSALVDAYAYATMMELEIYPGDKNKPLTGAQDASSTTIPLSAIRAEQNPYKAPGCTCPTGSVAFNCPVHGGQ